MSTGADYDYRESMNEQLEIEWCSGDAEMTEEEYEAGMYNRSQLRLARGGCYFEPRLVGTGYVRSLVVHSD